jgi:hypothetical protein
MPRLRQYLIENIRRIFEVIFVKTISPMGYYKLSKEPNNNSSQQIQHGCISTLQVQRPITQSEAYGITTSL